MFSQVPDEVGVQLMAHIDLVCKDCGHTFEVVTRGAIKPQAEALPQVRLGERPPDASRSYLRNGPLSDPNCGAPSCTSFG